MKKKLTLKKSQTDWNQLEALTDEEINFSDNSEATPEMFARAIVRKGLKPALKTTHAAHKRQDTEN
ncbi:MAG: hypothetical protein HY774_21830 [Acidobacteria bacterium]|nr:hypothetical protein [Acidobacteriota bacterium]